MAETLPLWLARPASSPRPPVSGRRRLARRLLVMLLAAPMAAALAQTEDVIAAMLATAYGSFLLTVALIDLDYRLVFNRMLLLSLPLVLALSLLPQTPSLLSSLGGGAIGLAAFWLIALVGRGAMGMGDVKLAGWIGLAVGFPAVITALSLGILLGGGAALALLVAHRFRRGHTLAYAPYLALGGWITLLMHLSA